MSYLTGPGGAGSVTSNEASAISAQAASAISVVSQAVSVLSQATSVTNAAQAVLNAALSVRIDTQSQAVSVLSQAVSVLSQAVSVVSQQVSVLSQAHSALSQKVSALSVRVSGISAGLSVRSVGNISTRGMQSIINALSNRVSAGTGGSATPTSNQFSIVSQQVSVISQKVSVLEGVSARNTAAVSVKGLQSILNALSNRISAAGGGTGSVTSTELSAAVGVSARSVGNVSSRGLQSAVNALSNRLSAGFVPLSVNRVALVGNEQVIEASAMTNISGLSVSVSAGVTYEMKAMVAYARSTAALNHPRLGLTFPAMTQIRGRLWASMSNSPSVTGVTVVGHFVVFSGDSASGSILVAAGVCAAQLSGLGIYEAMCRVSTTGVIQLQAAAAVNTLRIAAGSFLRVFRLS